MSAQGGGAGAASEGLSVVDAQVQPGPGHAARRPSGPHRAALGQSGSGQSGSGQSGLGQAGLGQAGSGGPAADWKPAILVCDDSPDIRQLMSVVLDRAGAEAILAPTGEDALASIATRRPDAVLLDLDLPGMSGLAVAEHLRDLAYDGPVIAVTGGGDELTPVALREHGFTDIVHKPTPGSVLVEVLCGHLPHWTPRRLRVGQAR